MNFNLLGVLTEEDRTKIENYIHLYGTKENFIGIDEWLKYWSVTKIKMYKMLGNQLIYRVPFEYNKSSDELNSQIARLVDRSNFPSILKNWVNINIGSVFPLEVYNYIYHCCSRYTLIDDEVLDSLKFKLEGTKKTLQLQKGAKPLRALNRFLTYCKDIEGAKEVIESFEEFRIAHSMILNDKVVKGNMVISIHPLDFMTMSDNNSHWQSCMSWKDNGCYHVGTIEMMNSNNVLCCYIENSDPYYFDPNELGNEEYRWANKKWRQLVYFTKDIIVSGKAYPYANDNISKALIETIRDLARKNLHWTYSFGPELYQDMKYIYTSYSMNRARNYIQWGDMKKHNILFDTRGMYNDMLNDHDTKYWCVRNKVKHNKIISYSGKAPCLCCGNSIIDNAWEDYDYNERFTNCNSSICEDCLTESRCAICDMAEPSKIHYNVVLENGLPIKICEDCVKNFFRKCPDCGRSMFVVSAFGRYNIFHDEDIDYPEIFIKLTETDNKDELLKAPFCLNKERIEDLYKNYYPICMCGHCAEKNSHFSKQTVTIHRDWDRDFIKEFLISKKIERKKDWEKYFLYNLEPAEICDGEIIIN